jgi:tetratricopeptide (TPR) repeat protein
MVQPETFGWIGVIGVIIGISGIVYAIYSTNQSAKQIDDLKIQLEKAKQDLENSSILNKNEIMLAIYEVNSIGMDEKLRDNYFITRFGFTYDKATKMLEYLNKTDDYSLGISGLIHGDFNTSLTHFDLALIKEPSNIEAKVGKSAALIGLNQTIEARSILIEIEPLYHNKAYFEKLLGDAYFNEEDYKNATEHYIKSLGLYFSVTGPKEIGSITILTRVCEIKYNGLYDSPDVSVTASDDGWKIGDVILRDVGLAIRTRYKIE